MPSHVLAWHLLAGLMSSLMLLSVSSCINAVLLLQEVKASLDFFSSSAKSTGRQDAEVLVVPAEDYASPEVRLSARHSSSFVPAIALLPSPLTFNCLACL